MKRTHYLLFLVTFLALAACKKEGCTDPNAMNYDPKAKMDDGSCEVEGGCECGCCDVIWNGSITSNTIWTSDKKYRLIGTVVVENGVTLTIEPGTIITGEEGSGTIASKLVIAQGGKIMAEGTPLNPIIFTSVLDNIQPRELIGTNLNENDRGLWGGVFIMGKAPISISNGDDVGQLEGIPVDETYGTYGGDDPIDDSGIFKYVSIRHAGAHISQTESPAGLTLAGVGSNTVISDVEVVAAADDGMRVYGGTVGISNAITGFSSDEGFDIRYNFDGTLDNFIVYRDTNAQHAIEVMGAMGATYTNGTFELKNGSVLGTSMLNNSGFFREKAKGVVTNVDFNGPVKLTATYDAGCTNAVEDCLYYLLEQVPELSFSLCNRTNIEILSICTVPANDQTSAESAFPSENATGASQTGWEWTWHSLSGFL